MLVVVNQPRTNFRIMGGVPKDILDYVEDRYGKENVCVLDDDGEELLDPHEQDWFNKAEASDSPGKNMRMFRRFAKLTQPQLADRLGTSKQAISNMENGIRPISKKTAKELARIFKVSVSNFI